MRRMDMFQNEEFLLTEKYRPITIKDTILPDSLKKTFQGFVDQKNIPNLLLCGTSGIGKTTIAKAMLSELNADYFMINASLDRGIDVLRNEITDYASTVSFGYSGRKYVILDEADSLSPLAQPALRAFIEQFSKNCGFILTCNYKNKIIQPLHSRCTVIDFKISKEDAPSLAASFLKRVIFILDNENITYDKKVIVEVIKKFFPDFRRAINELQRYSVNGVIDASIIKSFSNENFNELFSLMKKKDFTSVRKWVVENNSVWDSNMIYNEFYNNLSQYFEPTQIPSIVLVLAKYQYQEAFVVNSAINVSACFAEIMACIS